MTTCPGTPCLACLGIAGPDPVRAMTDIHRLQLFPAVFTVSPDAAAKLPSSWGGPCVQLIAAAKATLTALPFQVSPGHPPTPSPLSTRPSVPFPPAHSPPARAVPNHYPPFCPLTFPLSPPLSPHCIGYWPPKGKLGLAMRFYQVMLVP